MRCNLVTYDSIPTSISKNLSKMQQDNIEINIENLSKRFLNMEEEEEAEEHKQLKVYTESNNQMSPTETVKKKEGDCLLVASQISLYNSQNTSQQNLSQMFRNRQEFLFIFGGHNEQGYVNETEVLDLQSGIWRRFEGTPIKLGQSQ